MTPKFGDDSYLLCPSKISGGKCISFKILYDDIILLRAWFCVEGIVIDHGHILDEGHIFPFDNVNTLAVLHDEMSINPNNRTITITLSN